MTRKSLLVGYALGFSSFLMDSRISGKIRRIILFGSVARGDFNQESDIDIFIDSEHEIQKEIDGLLALFESSRINESWRLKGIENVISVKVGRLREWSLRRDVISSGILLYGKFKDMPEDVEYYIMIKIDTSNFEQSKQMRIWRRLYGYRQKVGKKIYHLKGLVEELNGKKLGRSIILVPMENRKEILDYLNKNRVKYTVNELWSDSL